MHVRAIEFNLNINNTTQHKAMRNGQSDYHTIAIEYGEYWCNWNRNGVHHKSDGPKRSRRETASDKMQNVKCTTAAAADASAALAVTQCLLFLI